MPHLPFINYSHMTGLGRHVLLRSIGVELESECWMVEIMSLNSRYQHHQMLGASNSSRDSGRWEKQTYTSRLIHSKQMSHFMSSHVSPSLSPKVVNNNHPKQAYPTCPSHQTSHASRLSSDAQLNTLQEISPNPRRRQTTLAEQLSTSTIHRLLYNLHLPRYIYQTIYSTTDIPDIYSATARQWERKLARRSDARLVDTSSRTASRV